jgi:hypothetical protein
VRLKQLTDFIITCAIRQVPYVDIHSTFPQCP